MKVLAATLATLLLLATCSPSEGHLGLTRALCLSLVPTDGVPSTCCTTYQQKAIPRSRVRSVFVTSSSCIKPGVIVVTKRKNVVCADPQEDWVQKLLKHFQSLKN
ncbi:CCL3 protein, partial [Notiomystis cincta]|nr:CCL3 protein [Notiomystis cincta]